MFFKKKKKMIDKIEEYLSYIDNCRDRFENCMNSFFNQEKEVILENMVNVVHQAESKADDLRRAIECELYQKNLIPSSRGDILGVLETIDKIPNAMEKICYQIYLQKIAIPDEYKVDISELIKINIEAYNKLKNVIIGYLNNNKKNVVDDIKEVDLKESQSDKLEMKLINLIYSSKIDKSDKVLLNDVITNLGKISNNAQSVADRLTLAFIKRDI